MHDKGAESGEYWRSHRVSTEYLIEVCENINDFVDEPVSPLVEEFASVFASPYLAQYKEDGVYWSVTPWEVGYQGARFLQLLRMKGHCGGDEYYEGLLRYIPPNLLNVDDDELKELYLTFPTIVKEGFPQDFAQEVEMRWEGILKNWGYKEDLPSKTVDEIEPVADTVTTAEQAKIAIIDSAQEIITSLDWQWALGNESLTVAKIAELFQAYFPRALKNMYIIPHIAVLAHDQNEDDLNRMTEDQKVELNNNTSLVLPLGPVSAEDANFLRAALCIDVVEEISRHFGSDEAAGKLLMTNPVLSQAIMNTGLKSLGLGPEE